jgi:hypothetical protein
VFSLEPPPYRYTHRFDDCHVDRRGSHIERIQETNIASLSSRTALLYNVPLNALPRSERAREHIPSIYPGLQLYSVGITAPQVIFGLSPAQFHGLVCSIEEGPYSPIRRGSANNAHVIPTPVYLTAPVATLSAVACSFVATWMLIKRWGRVIEINWKTRLGNLDRVEESIKGTNGTTIEGTKNGLCHD